MGKWLLRLAVSPVLLVLTILEWVGTYILQVVRILCALISGMIIVLTIVDCFMGLASGKQTVTELVVSFLFYLIPKLAGFTVSIIVLMKAAIMRIIQK